MNFPRRNKEQKITVSCLLRHGDEVLLLRSDQAKNEANYNNVGYFNLPRFTLPFGENPRDIIRQEIESLFEQEIAELELLEVLPSQPNEYTHIVNIIYGGQVKDEKTAPVVGKYMFTKLSELEDYTFPTELEKIRRFFTL